MGVKIDPKSKKVLVRIEKLDKQIPRNLRRGLYFVGKKLKETASKNILKRGRSGRVYKYKGRRHISSSPGESWANRSGEARRGLIYKVSSPTKLIFGNTVEHAKFMEFGTKTIQPRPAHLISIKQNNRNIIKILNNEIKKALT